VERPAGALVSCNYQAMIMQPLCSDHATIRQLSGNTGTGREEQGSVEPIEGMPTRGPRSESWGSCRWQRCSTKPSGHEGQGGIKSSGGARAVPARSADKYSGCLDDQEIQEHWWPLRAGTARGPVELHSALHKGSRRTLALDTIFSPRQTAPRMLVIALNKMGLCIANVGRPEGQTRSITAAHEEGVKP
jgi:hypothetical protein